MSKKVAGWMRAEHTQTKRFNETKKIVDSGYEVSYRNMFQRDKDRILYSRAFRRLKGKTQVFLAGFDDHMRDRLTHTLEVAQLAKTISSSLGLDEDLTEAIALGHDIGHTPFGHVGERTLNEIMSGKVNIKNFNMCSSEQKGFKHNWQSLRVLEELEKDEGLNLTNYTLWGILNHSSLKMRGYDKRPQFYSEKYSKLIDNSNENWTIEALIVRVADEIAQRHHDIEDGLFAKIIGKDEVLNLFKETFKDKISTDNKFIPYLIGFKEIDNYTNDLNKLLEKIEEETDKVVYTPDISNLIIKYYMLNYINHLKESIESIEKELKSNDKSLELSNVNYELYIKPLIDKEKLNKNYYLFHFDKKFSEMDDKFQNFLMNKVLNSHMVQVMDGQGNYIIRKLFEAYVTNPLQLPDNGILSVYKNILKFKEKVDEIDTIKRKNVGKLRNCLSKFHSKLLELEDCDTENLLCKGDDKEVTFIDEKLTFNEYHHILFRTIADYIGGMTDEFTIKEFQKLYGIKMM